MQCGKCGVESSIKKAGFFKNRNGIVQRYFCFSCQKTFSISNNNGMRIHKEKVYTVMKMLCENSGIRQIHRVTRLHQETVLKILKISGNLAHHFMDGKINNLKCEVIQADELHTIVHAKDWNVNPKDKHLGSQYTFMAADSRSRFLISSFTGQRTAESAETFLHDVKQRVTGRFQLNTDCWLAYKGRKNVVKRVFGQDIDHATEQKHFWKRGEFISRSLAKTERKAHIGNPDLTRGSTSYIERTNLTLRNLNRRFTRCTLGFSRKLLNLRFAVSLFMWSFNFSKKHSTLNKTPAIAIGLCSDIMSVCQLWNFWQ
jgi:transposase-like protein/IS1 family transposase